MGVKMRERRMGGTESNEREITDGRRGEENRKRGGGEGDDAVNDGTLN